MCPDQLKHLETIGVCGLPVEYCQVLWNSMFVIYGSVLFSLAWCQLTQYVFV